MKNPTKRPAKLDLHAALWCSGALVPMLDQDMARRQLWRLHSHLADAVDVILADKIEECENLPMALRGAIERLHHAYELLASALNSAGGLPPQERKRQVHGIRQLFAGVAEAEERTIAELASERHAWLQRFIAGE